MPIESQFDPIRFYTNLDPYNWTVDNRPIEDLDNNIGALASYSNAIFDSAKSAAMAAGFVARGFATDNMYVGLITYTPESFNLTIEHGFLVQSLQASAVPPVDLKTYPHLGLQQSQYVITSSYLTKPSTPGQKNCHTVQARKISANSSISFYDPTNINEGDAFVVGIVQYGVKTNAGIASIDDDSFPDPDAGWISVFHISIDEADTELTGDNVQYDKFLLDGAIRDASQYEVHTVNVLRPQADVYDVPALTPTNTGITDIAVSAQDAMVFVDGVYQNPTKYTVVSISEILWGEVLPDGSVVDFVIIKGSSINLAAPGSAIYAYNVESFIGDSTPGGQQTFGPTSLVDVQYAFVFVNGVFQPDTSYNSIAQTVTLPAPVPVGTNVDLVATAGGIVSGGVPPGGAPGQILQVNSSGISWEYPIHTATVTAIPTNTTVATDITTSADFDITTELFDGMRVRLLGFGTSGSYVGNASSNVTVTIDSIPLPVYRPRGGAVRPDDLYDGVILAYDAAALCLVVSSPASEGRIFGTATGTINTDSIAVVPDQPVFNLFSGLQLTFVVPGAAATTSAGVTVTMSLTVDGSPVSTVIRRSGGADLRAGDMVAEQVVTVQYDDFLGMWTILNPAIQSAASAAVELVGLKRQTVLTGPRGRIAGLQVQNAGASVGITNIVSSYPNMLRICTSGGTDTATDDYFKVFSTQENLIGAEVRITTSARCSFSAGYDSAGAVEYIEALPTSSVFSKAALASTYFGGTPGFGPAGITSVSQVAGTGITVTVSTPHGYSVGQWVRISGESSPALNGVYQIKGVPTGTTFVLHKQTTLTVSTAGTGYVEGVLFIYADRNPGTGVVTYGVTPYRPFYYDGSLSDQISEVWSKGLRGLMTLNDRHVFDVDKMIMTVGNGSTYSEVQRVFIGEVYLNSTSFVYTAPGSMQTYAYNGQSVVWALGSQLVPSRQHYIPNGMGTRLYNVTSVFSIGPDTPSIASADVNQEVLAHENAVFRSTIGNVEDGAGTNSGLGVSKWPSHVNVYRHSNGDYTGYNADGATVTYTLATSDARVTLYMERTF